MAEDKREDIGENLTDEEKQKAEEERRRTGNGNLRIYNELTTEQKRALHSAGGKASAEKKKKRRQAAEILDQMLAHELTEEQATEILGTAIDVLDGDLSLYAVMNAKIAQKACAGDTYAYTVIRDTAGDKPVDRQEVHTTVTEEDMKLIENVRKRLGVNRGNNAQKEV